MLTFRAPSDQLGAFALWAMPKLLLMFKELLAPAALAAVPARAVSVLNDIEGQRVLIRRAHEIEVRIETS